MPAGKHKSRSLRRVFKKTPGGKTVLHYIKRNVSKAHCGSCGRVLAGVARGRPAIVRNIPKTQKRPERPFGGVLCTTCSRRVAIEEARVLKG